jgi:hypothetical protein
MLAPRYVPWAILTAAAGAVLALAASGALRTRPAVAASGAGGPDHAREKHYVGPRQLADTNALVRREAGELRAAAHDGRVLGWDDLSGGRPLALVFIKAGCPCSVEVEPFFRRVEALYRGEVRFAGVIDGDTDSARRYATEQDVAHPVLADPDKQIVGRFRAKCGCHVVLLTPAGVIDGAWPGCSAETMRQLGRRIALLAGVDERPLDTSGMPTSLTTGCPYKGPTAGP